MPSHERVAEKKPTLPTHCTREQRLEDSNLSYWKEKHREADVRLLRLEKELDQLFDWALIVRDARTELTQNRQYPEGSSKVVLEDSHKMDEYISLAHKSRTLEDMIQALKEECATCRSECNYFSTKINRLSPRSKWPQLLRSGMLHTQDTLPRGGPESGFTDPGEVVKRIMDAEDTATGMGAVVGALGAGIAYTTLFSATRGRLDLIAWAFTCFVFVVMSCAAFQVFALPRHGQKSRLFRMEYIGSAEHRLFSYVLLVALPIVAGFIFLALSVALLDADSTTTVSGSQLAIRVAGYLPIGFLGYFVVAMVMITLMAISIRILSRYGVLQWPTEHLPREARRAYPSLLFAVKDKLFFLPGGKGYTHYREARRLREERNSGNNQGNVETGSTREGKH